MAVTLKSIRINNQISASYALTASYALNGGGGGGGGSVPANTVSSSAQLSNGGGTAFTTSNNITVGSVTGSLLGTSSFANAFNPLPTTNNTYLVYQNGVLKWVPIVSAVVAFSPGLFSAEYVVEYPQLNITNISSIYNENNISTEYSLGILEAPFDVPLALSLYSTGWTSGSI